MPSEEALRSGFIALNRFGYGSRGDGDLAAAAGDPRGFVKAELLQPGIALLDGADLQATPILLQALFADQERVRLEREAAKVAQAPSSAPPAAAGANEPSKPDASKPDVSKPEAPKVEASPPKRPNIEQEAFRIEAFARIQRAATARVGLVERLVAFWSNHFCVSARKSQFSRITCGSFEREAIRPFVLGRFADMLKAVEQHPAMLHYLDNQQSIGPNSRAGQNGKRGLNENLGREILELHTLGVGSGYSQNDVTALAAALTGWTVVGRDGRLGIPGNFVFNPDMHEPGGQTILGKTYAAAGREQAESVLVDLAHHPATARHVAGKFAAHFVADAPPPALVERLAKRFQESGGDLQALTVSLIDADEAWRAPAGKMRSPYEFLLAASRMIGRLPDNANPLLYQLTLLGMPLWQPPGPNGWGDTAQLWASPEGIKQRLDVAALIAGRLRDVPNPSELLERVAGSAASSETRQAVARAESRQQGLALLLMSPEIQRR